MSERIFRMRIFCDYKEPDNTVESQQVELFKGNEWTDFDLDTGTAGFLIFVYAVLACQQMHLRLGCKDRGLKLASAAGDIEIATTEDWIITKLQVNFSAVLTAGEASEEDRATVIQRMKSCPVSKNLTFAPGAETTLEFRLN
ncbi:MAG: OsmC family protein [Pseudomonadota bacterium]